MQMQKNVQAVVITALELSAKQLERALNAAESKGQHAVAQAYRGELNTVKTIIRDFDTAELLVVTAGNAARHGSSDKTEAVSPSTLKNK